MPQPTDKQVPDYPTEAELAYRCLYDQPAATEDGSSDKPLPILTRAEVEAQLNDVKWETAHMTPMVMTVGFVQESLSTILQAVELLEENMPCGRCTFYSDIYGDAFYCEEGSMCESCQRKFAWLKQFNGEKG